MYPVDSNVLASVLSSDRVAPFVTNTKVLVPEALIDRAMDFV